MSHWHRPSRGDLSELPKTPAEARQAIEIIDEDIAKEHARLLAPDLGSVQQVRALKKSVEDHVKALLAKRKRLLP